MYYRCTNCNTAKQFNGRPTTDDVCPVCKKRNENIDWDRAERVRIIERDEVYRSGPKGEHWRLNEAKNKFIKVE